MLSLVRYCASGRNAQPLRYLVVTDKNNCDKVFQNIKWAGFLTDWDGPKKGERPTAYIIQLLDTRIVKDCLCDDGLHLQTITMAAVDKGLGACIFKSFNNGNLRIIFELPEYMQILYVVAIGKPIEEVVITDQQGEDYKYWRDNNGTHYVPKRSVDELLNF